MGFVLFREFKAPEQQEHFKYLKEAAAKLWIAGTELSVVQEGIPQAIPLDMCYLGWQDSLLQLAALVEPDIPG